MNKTETGRGWIIHLKSPAEEWQSTDTLMEFAFRFFSFYFYILKIYLFFNWRIIALWYYVAFCHTATWISHRYTCVPLPLEAPSHSPPHPTPLGCHTAELELPESHSKFPLAIYFTYGSVCFWRRQWQPTPVLLPGKSHGRRSLVGCSPWGR